MNWTAYSPHEIASRYGFLPSVCEGDDDGASMLGAGLPDFNALIQADPTFAAGWNDIAPELAAEGATDLTGAKIALADAYTNLIGSSFGSVDPSSAIAAAKKYVQIGQTIAGAAGNVASLIQAGNSGANPIDVFRGFTGVMIGLAVSTGLSAGMGAVIVGAVGLSLDAVQLFSSIVGGPKQVYDSTDPQCAYGPFNIDKANPPSFGVGCIAAWGPSYTPDSPYWRPFPTPPTFTMVPIAGGLIPIPTTPADNLADAAWFVRGQIGPGAWRGAFFGVVNQNSNQNNTPDKWWSPPGVNPAGTDTNARPVDNAFPAYASIIEGNGGFGQFDTSTWPPDWTATFQTFVAAFQAAWRANAAYTLNGLKAQADWAVLVHLLRMWNIAHDGPGYSLLDSSPNTIGSLVTQALGAGSQQEISDGSGHGLVLNLGPLKQVVPVGAPSTGPAAASATSSSTGGAGTAAVVVAGTAIAGAGFWVLLGQPMSLAALKAAVEEVVHAGVGYFKR